MAIFNILEPNDYPIYITLGACIVLVIAMVLINYRRINPVHAALFFIGSFVFMHLNLATYRLTLPLATKFWALFNQEAMHPILSAIVDISGYIILTFLPFLVWFIPLVMLDEQLCDIIQETEQEKFKKSAAICIVGMVVNLFFVLSIFQSMKG